MLVDTYVQSSDAALLEAFCKRFVDVIGPCRGRPEIQIGGEVDGKTVTAVAASGDPCFWYAAIRGEEKVSLCEGICFCQEEVAKAVLGVWA